MNVNVILYFNFIRMLNIMTVFSNKSELFLKLLKNNYVAY